MTTSQSASPHFARPINPPDSLPKAKASQQEARRQRTHDLLKARLAERVPMRRIQD